MIGRLLGHMDVGSTARYAHLARDAEKVAVARVGGSIEADLLRVEAGVGDGRLPGPGPAGPAGDGPARDEPA